MSNEIPSRGTRSLRSGALHESLCGLSIAAGRIAACGPWRADAPVLPIRRGVESKSSILRMMAKATTAARGVRSIRGPTSPVVPAFAQRPFGSLSELLEMISMWEPSRKIA